MCDVAEALIREAGGGVSLDALLAAEADGVLVDEVPDVDDGEGTNVVALASFVTRANRLMVE